jgi:uncharacterized protein YprB with RNaseH-like and TPR domain
MLNVNLMLKAEMLDRHNYRCQHRHNGFDHPACFDKARAVGERIGFLDIESGGSLDADWGLLLTYCIKALNGTIYWGAITPAEVRAPLMGGGTKDKRLLEKFCKDVWNFDTLVVYYGRDVGGQYQRHDIPFLRTRCARWGIEGFPEWKQIKVIDLFDIVKKYFKLSKRTMANACRLFKIPAKGLPFNVEVWQDALAGHQPAMDYILKHNRQDVISTEKLFKAVIKYRGSRGRI